MLNFVKELATKNNVNITTHKCNIEDLNLPKDILFDVIYVGNLFHHVLIDKTIINLKKYLHKDGVMISWDPIAYNPLINLYRMIATKVRTDDEHPLKKSDLLIFEKHFKKIDTKYFWFTTLIIFILMMLVYNPNKVRLWKKIIHDEKKYKWIYEPLERLDKCLLMFFPFLKWQCWNVVIKCHGSINEK